MTVMKLLIVEDEERTRELLRRFVAWEEIGIREVETARNGQDALRLTKQWQPDIVLCDVRMPKMDGIEFATLLRESDPRCKLIFLSGFSDKEYLKSALHLKAITYLEKPVNLEEVRAAVEEAVGAHAEEIRKRQHEERLQDGFDRYLPFLRQVMVRRLTAGPIKDHVRTALLSEETFLLPPKGPYTVVAAALYWSLPEHPEDPSTVQERLLYEWNVNEKLLSRNVLCGFDNRNWLILIVPGVFGSSYRERRQDIEELFAELKAVAGPGIEIRLGVGTPADRPEDIPHSYVSAYQAGSLQFYMDGSKPLYVDSLGGNKPLQTDWEQIRNLRDALRKGEIALAERIIREFAKQARAHADLNIVRMKDAFFQLLLAILEVSIEQGLTGPSEDDERGYIWKEIDRIPCMDRLENYMLAFLQPFADNRTPRDGTSGKIREIVRYIYANYHEKGFSIQDISSRVNLSETYLCSYFKKQQGRTLKEFITETRIEKAKEILREHEIKLFEVAVRTGFSDPNYFTTVFKRFTGMTPTEFRERMAR